LDLRLFYRLFLIRWKEDEEDEESLEDIDETHKKRRRGLSDDEKAIIEWKVNKNASCHPRANKREKARPQKTYPTQRARKGRKNLYSGLYQEKIYFQLLFNNNNTKYIHL